MQSLSGVDVPDTPLEEYGTEAPTGTRASPIKPAIDPRRLVRELAAYREPQLSRSIFELTSTAIPFLILSGSVQIAVSTGYWAALLLTPLCGLFLLRLFLIQHDCGHGSFFRGRSANDWLGRTIGIFTLTPYKCWRRAHALHHAGTGNLDARGFGDIDTLTIDEFRSKSRFGRLLYRLYRHPLILFGLGPAYQFLLRHRLPFGLATANRGHWISAMGSNVATALLVLLLAQWFSPSVLAIVLVPIVLTAAAAGMWLFYVQHQFEDAHWDQQHRWSFHDAALLGSSHLALPPALRWFTANIGVHHVHHLASRVPFYRLPEVLAAFPELAAVNRLTPRQTLATLRLALWDERARRLVPIAAA